MKRLVDAAFIVAALSGLAAFEYHFLVWLSGPYECVNCEPSE